MTQVASPKKGEILTVSLLVAGTCIGGGMLGLPVGCALAGFWPSLLMTAVSWLMMTLSALLILEVNLWMPRGSHMISMASRFLGPAGKALAWVLYLFIGYASLTGYTAGGGAQIASNVSHFFDMSIGKFVGSCICMGLFSWSLFLGAKAVGRLNNLLFFSMIFAYFALVFCGGSEISYPLLQREGWSYAPLTLPLLLTAFSFQTIVPSLTPELKNDAKALRTAVIAGSALAFIVYIAWLAIVLGTVPPQGEYGLFQAYVKGEAATEYLRHAVSSPYLANIAEFFAFFALITSFLGIGLGLFDFLADGFKIEKKGFGNLALGLMVILPSLFFATKFERVFLVAMETSGGFGDALLNGIFPVLMVWIGRYKMQLSSDLPVPGGKKLLVFTLLFYMAIFGLELWEQASGLIITSAD